MKKQATPEVHPIADFRDAEIPALDMPFDFPKADRTWEKKYGIIEPPLNVRSDTGEWYDDGRFKGIFRNGHYRTIVSRSYPTVPNEEIREILTEFVDNSKELKIVKEYTSHHGDAMYWQVLSNRTEEVAKGDKVQIGCIVRNSIGTYMTLGADLFTYRLICSNGAIAKGHDLGSIAVQHRRERSRMVGAFTQGLEHIINRTVDLTKYYRAATKIKVNKQIAEAWASRIPQRILPKQIEVDTKNDKVTLTGSPNLWDAFNDITANSWKNLRQGEEVAWKTVPGFLTKYHTTLHAHKVLIQAVDGTLGKSKKAIAV